MEAPSIKPLIIGNWKMNGSNELITHFSESFQSSNYPDIEVAILPPTLFIKELVKALQTSTVKVGAQNTHAQMAGPHTGEISATMLAKAGCQLALAGHSERRLEQRETNSEVADKCAAIAAASMTPVLCIGETLNEYQQQQTETVIIEQLNALLTVLDQSALATLAIAYEPVWAIGTGEAAKPAQVNDVHALIRNWLKEHSGDAAKSTHIIYGGSVSKDNAADLMAQPQINGLLVGKASLDVVKFSDVLIAVSNAT